MLDMARPYPAYKDSGQPWLGEVPEHWDVRSLGATTLRQSGRGEDNELPLLSVLREKGVVLRSSLRQEENHNFIPDDLSNYRLAREGDLVINKMKAWQGSVGVAPCDGVVSPAYYVFELLGIEKAFAHRLFRSPFYKASFAQASDGVRIGQWDLSIDRMKRIPVPVPPPSEQAAIFKVLSAVDRRVNRLVRAKRRLLALLAEQKQAVITHAVTRGLDPDAPTKPSGVPWLGEVPAHWEMTPNRQLLVLKKKLVGDAWEDHTLLSLTKRGIIERDMENPEGKFPSSFETYQVVEPGDFVFCLFDIDETPRAVGLSDLSGMITGAYTRFQCRRDKYAKFIYYYYLAMDSSKSLKPLYTGLRKVIQKSTFRAAPMPLPPVDEAQRIVAAVEETIQKIDATADLARREIDLIREYRTRLVADVVTGKLDVRAVAESLPDEAENEEPAETDEADAGEAADELEPVLEGEEA